MSGCLSKSFCLCLGIALLAKTNSRPTRCPQPSPDNILLSDLDRTRIYPTLWLLVIAAEEGNPYPLSAYPTPLVPSREIPSNCPDDKLPLKLPCLRLKVFDLLVAVQRCPITILPVSPALTQLTRLYLPLGPGRKSSLQQ